MKPFLYVLLALLPLTIHAETPQPSQILNYWFGQLQGPSDFPSGKAPLWFKKSDETDQEIRDHFFKAYEKAARGDLAFWAKTPRGRLALVILMDQMSRNMFRGTPQAFATDDQALFLTLSAIAKGEDLKLYPIERAFLYMPLQHSEDPVIQDLSVRKFSDLYNQAPDDIKPMLKSYADYSRAHQEVIDRFGRFPHRNQSLGRPSTPEETEFLKTPGSSF